MPEAVATALGAAGTAARSLSLALPQGCRSACRCPVGGLPECLPVSCRWAAGPLLHPLPDPCRNGCRLPRQVAKCKAQP
jgi:hypothetical protein